MKILTRFSKKEKNRTNRVCLYVYTHTYTCKYVCTYTHREGEREVYCKLARTIMEAEKS